MLSPLETSGNASLSWLLVHSEALHLRGRLGLDYGCRRPVVVVVQANDARAYSRAGRKLGNVRRAQRQKGAPRHQPRGGEGAHHRPGGGRPTYDKSPSSWPVKTAKQLVELQPNQVLACILRCCLDPRLAITLWALVITRDASRAL